MEFSMGVFVCRVVGDVERRATPGVVWHGHRAAHTSRSLANANCLVMQSAVINVLIPEILVGKPRVNY